MKDISPNQPVFPNCHIWLILYLYQYLMRISIYFSVICIHIYFYFFGFPSHCLIWRDMAATCTTTYGGDRRILGRSGVMLPRWGPNMLSTTQQPTCLMRSKSRPSMSLDQDLSPMWSLDTLERTVSRCTLDIRLWKLIPTLTLGLTLKDSLIWCFSGWQKIRSLQCHQWIISHWF